MRHIIAVLLENEAGALSRVVGLFSQRNYNIDSLTVAPTEDPTLSRVTLITTGDDSKIDQIIKHLYKVIEVVKVVDLSESEHVERELMLIKLRAEGPARDEVKRNVVAAIADAQKWGLTGVHVMNSSEVAFSLRGRTRSSFFDRSAQGR